MYDELVKRLRAQADAERFYSGEKMLYDEAADAIEELKQIAEHMDRRRTKSLEGKCGSCRFFVAEQGRECTGFCSGRMKRKGRLWRTYKCIGYEDAPTVIPADKGEET